MGEWALTFDTNYFLFRKLCRLQFQLPPLRKKNIVPIRKTNCLMLLTEIIAVYSENIKPTNYTVDKMEKFLMSKQTRELPW